MTLQDKLNQLPECIDARHCFARRLSLCTILRSAYPKGECPFCKEHRDDKRREEENTVEL